jgi:hypothetical protein
MKKDTLPPGQTGPVLFASRAEIKLRQELAAVREKLASAESTLDHILAITYLRMYRDMIQERSNGNIVRTALLNVAMESLENAYPEAMQAIIHGLLRR